MNSCGPWCAKCSSNGITTSSSTPSCPISSALASRLVSSFGAASGPDDLQWMGLERQHRVAPADHLPVPEVHAVKLADGDSAWPWFGLRKHRHLHRRRRVVHRRAGAAGSAPPEPDDRLYEARFAAPSARAIRPSASTSRTSRPPRRGRRHRGLRGGRPRPSSRSTGGTQARRSAARSAQGRL